MKQYKKKYRFRYSRVEGNESRELYKINCRIFLPRVRVPLTMWRHWPVCRALNKRTDFPIGVHCALYENNAIFLRDEIQVPLPPPPPPRPENVPDYSQVTKGRLECLETMLLKKRGLDNVKEGKKCAISSFTIQLGFWQLYQSLIFVKKKLSLARYRV